MSDEDHVGGPGSSVGTRLAAAGTRGGEARQGHVPAFLRRGGVGPVRARRRHAALVLVRRVAQGLRRHRSAGGELRDGVLGAGRDRARQLAGRAARAEGRRRGLGRSEKARAVGAKTQRERDWIEAIAAYYRDHDSAPLSTRLAAYTRAMEQMTQRYPDDFEAWTYYALTLQASAPKNDKTYASQLKSAEILEQLFTQNPDHPGVAHYLVHAYDYPPLADKGISIAAIYARIAPAAPHARHMPSHVYSMVGMWEESIASNRSALEIQPDYHHATDFMVYAHLQLGQDVRVKALVDAIAALPRPDSASVPGVTAITAIPARYVLERGDWAGAAGLRMTPTGRPQGDSLTRFTRGLGMARSGDLAGAKGEVQAMQALRGALATSNQSYWAERTDEQMLAVSAWVALAEGATDQAVKLMRAAADGEDSSVKHVAMENRLYPMRELLGELLLQMGQAAPALREFEASLRENPNRYRGLYGAARAAEVAGDRPKATEYFEKLMALARKADTARPEIVHAKAFLGQR